MLTSKLKPIYYLTYSVNRNIVRTAAVNAASVNVDEEQVQLKPWTEIPGPSSLPIIGQLHHFLPGGILADIKRFQDNVYELYGPIVRLDSLGGRPPFIFVYDPESCATILRGENWMPVRPGFDSLEYYRKHYKKTKKSLYSTGLLTEHNEPWKKTRSTVNPVMLQPKTIKLYASVLDEVADDMVTRMRSIRNKKNMLEGKLDVEMNLWALESIGVVALGGRLNCFDPNLPEDSPARRLIRCVHEIFSISIELDFKPSLWKYISTKTYRKAMNIYEEQETLARYFVHKAIIELKTKEKTDDEKGVLEKLLEIDEDIAVTMACDMLFAGVDTAANTILATMYLLAANPEKQNKLRKELTSGREQRPYLKACLKESLRMMPVVSGNARLTSKEYNILGYKIPKDITVVLGHHKMSLLDSQFHQAQEYIPERWVEKDSPLYHNNVHPFAYSPFGFGVRMCIGRRIAELEMETFLAKVIQNFQIEWFGPPPEINMTSLNYVLGPYNFIFKDV